MFNQCSRDPTLSRISFGAAGVVRSMSTSGIAAFCVGQALSGVSLLKLGQSEGSDL